MAGVNFDFSKIEKQIETAAMDRLEGAAKIIRDNAKTILQGQMKGGWREHGPYRRFRATRIINEQKVKVMTPYSGGSGPAWTARHYEDMIKTIRTHRDDDEKNIWILAGNYLTWWAVQMEFGLGGWVGGRKSFLRPAMEGSASQIKGYLEGGAIGGREI